jgi:cytochrome P450
VLTDSFVQETVRLAGSAFMVRGVAEDTWFKTSSGQEHLVRAGDMVAIYPPAIHRDPGIFTDPLVGT